MRRRRLGGVQSSSLLWVDKHTAQKCSNVMRRVPQWRFHCFVLPHDSLGVVFCYVRRLQASICTNPHWGCKWLLLLLLLQQMDSQCKVQFVGQERTADSGWQLLPGLTSWPHWGFVVAQIVTHTCPGLGPGPNFHSVGQGSHSSSWSHSRSLFLWCGIRLSSHLKDPKNVEVMWRVSLIPCHPGLHIRRIKADQSWIDQFPRRRLTGISLTALASHQSSHWARPQAPAVPWLAGTAAIHPSVRPSIRKQLFVLCFGGSGWCGSSSQSSTGNNKSKSLKSLLVLSGVARSSLQHQTKTATHTKPTFVWLVGGQHTVSSSWTLRYEAWWLPALRPALPTWRLCR